MLFINPRLKGLYILESCKESIPDSVTGKKVYGVQIIPLQHILDEYIDNINEGDIFIANDPHVAGGTHLPDINMAMPVFNKGELIAFVANIVHHADVGGAAVGSMSGGLNEIYKEGLRIPLIRLYKKGEIVHDIFRFLLFIFNNLLFSSKIMSILSSTHGYTQMLAKLVCLLAPESKGDILTNLCTPDSFFIKPYKFSPVTFNVQDLIPASSPLCSLINS